MANTAKIKLRYMGRQGMCRYWGRIFRDGFAIMYYKIDGGILAPVSNSPIVSVEEAIRRVEG